MKLLAAFIWGDDFKFEKVCVIFVFVCSCMCLSTYCGKGMTSVFADFFYVKL